jgi:hypothetical protein
LASTSDARRGGSSASSAMATARRPPRLPITHTREESEVGARSRAV